MRLSLRLSETSTEAFNKIAKDHIFTDSPSAVIAYALAYVIKHSPEKILAEASPVKTVDKPVDKLIEKPKLLVRNGVTITQAMKDEVKAIVNKDEKKKRAFELLNNPPRFSCPEGELSTWDTIILNYFK